MNRAWAEIPGWCNFERLYWLMASRFSERPGVFVEVGSYMGRSAVCMAEALDYYKSDVRLYCVDHFEGSVEHKNNPTLAKDLPKLREIFQTYTKPWELIKHALDRRRIYTIASSSEEASRQFGAETCDFVFLDASHDYESVKKDIQMWLPKVKKGGYIGGDDFSPGYMGVVQAAQEAFGPDLVSWFENGGYGSWLYLKPEA